jgi:hypothetical protein
MQKVEGSSPFIRFKETRSSGGFFLPERSGSARSNLVSSASAGGAYSVFVSRPL